MSNTTELEAIREDGEASTSSKEEGAISSSSSLQHQKQANNKMASHLVTSLNRDVVIQAPNIGNIIEEEDEEGEEEKYVDEQGAEKKKEMKDENKNVNEAKKVVEDEEATSQTDLPTKAINTTLSSVEPPAANSGTTTSPTSSSTTNSVTVASKFILESVNLDNLQPASSSSSSSQQPTTTTTSDDRPERPESTSTEPEVELPKVEEGYATRQMDEYFRQTIAAIKEEINKKQETKQEPESGTDHHHHNHHHHVGLLADEDDLDGFGSTDVEFEEAEGGEATSNLTSKTSDDYYCSNCRDNNLNRSRNNRTMIYHNLIGKKSGGDSAEVVNSWLVLIGCFINQFIVDGVCYNYANLFELIQKEFKYSSKLIATLPGALLLAFFLLMAPMAVFLSKQFGTRRVAVVGTFISTFSLLVCSLMNNIVAFIVFYGIFTGVGLSLIYVPSMLAISKWFVRKRLFANSLAQFGACLGATLYPICSELVLRKYGLFDSFLILAGVQLNCLVGSLLLRDNSHVKISSVTNHHNSSQQPCCRAAQDKLQNKQQQKPSHKKSSSSAALLIENEHNNNNVTLNSVAKNKYIRPGNYHHPHYLDASETESTNSVSTTTTTNYTLKQYWRKFIQTRKTTSNTKKNLFHLIAEEKRKTRTLSKTSLEDGFVITTSNNLLAPNDDSHVIVSRNNKQQQQQNQLANPEVASISTSSKASKFFSRIAHSLRSLTTHGSTNVAASSGAAAVAANTPNQVVNINIDNTQSKANLPPITQVPEVNEKISAPVIPLMSVFDGPLTTDVANNNNNNNNTDTSTTTTTTTTTTTNTANHQQPQNPNLSPTNSDDDEDDSDEDESASAKIHRNSSQISQALKNQRYLTYRASLANSVRGSLMEYSVPEENRNDADDNDDDNSSNSDGEENATSGEQKRRIQKAKSSFGARHIKNFSQTPLSSTGYALTNMNGGGSMSKNQLTDQLNDDTVGYAKPTIYNLRRFISTLETSSFYNVPLNLESIEYNLKNSLTKGFADHYRKQHKNMRKSIYHKKYNLILYLDYLSYLTSFKLFVNPILFLLNLSFFLHMAGFCVVLVYICEFGVKRNLARAQCVYVLALIGFSVGIGRLISTISYKVNASNAKSRIFAYVLTVLLNGICVLSSTLLCDTLFSFCVFAISFGVLVGFNLNLRTVMIYDMMALEWSDDSLFFFTLFSQALGAAIGVPLASLIFDVSKDDVYVFYYAGACFLLSALILSPGRKIRIYCYSSYKSLNKFYLQRRFH